MQVLLTTLLLSCVVPTVLLQTTDSGCNCVDCKEIVSGTYTGSYQLSTDSAQQARCSTGCFYTNIEDGTELCLCDPGDVEYVLADTCYSQLTQDQIDTILRISRSTVRTIKNKVVRLTFHDCVGGCNGCLNVNNSDNNGLADIVADIETVYQENNFSEIISRADLWALLGIWSINQTIIANNEDCDTCEEVPDLEVTFKWGRKDCATAPYSDDDVGLPAATSDHVELMEFFSDEFDFNDREVTALMGVHTLGAAKLFNSGFQGTWVSGGGTGGAGGGGATFFNNQYYINMASFNWTLAQKLCTSFDSDPNFDTALCSTGQTTGWQWNVVGEGFNLNADMSLFKDFDTASDGEPSCTYLACPSAPTASVVEEFAASNTVWIQEFSEVYTKMLAHGSDELQDVD